MFEATSAARAFVSEGHRLPLARPRITANRTPQRDRPTTSAPLASIAFPHRDACRLAVREAQCRLVQALLVAALVKRRLWRPLGFARLPDYAAERLGMHARSLQEDARVVTALAMLPRIHAALGTGAIRWTHARLLAGVATPSSEDEWLGLALASTTRELAELVKAARAKTAPAEDHEPSREADTSPDACASPRPAAIPAADDSEPSDPPMFWSIVVTRAGRRLWRTVGDLASRMCGVDVPASRVAEAVAAEATSWDVWEPPLAEPLPRRAARERAVDESCEEAARAEAPIFLEPDPDLQELLLDLDDADAHEIDRRLRAVRSSMQKIDAELGAVLRKAVEQNVPRRLGFAGLRSYSESRLGICGSKAMALVRLDRQCALQSPALRRAYHEGREIGRASCRERV